MIIFFYKNQQNIHKNIESSLCQEITAVLAITSSVDTQLYFFCLD